jgi:Carboxypeptidase regulatory-like domain
MSNSSVRWAGGWLALVSMLFVWPVFTFGQSAAFGTISGIVTDPSGALMPAVSVSVVNLGTQARYSTKTDSSGLFTVPNLPSGNYDVIAEKKGFQRYENTNVHLDPAASVEVHCQMAVGTVSQTVHVTSPLVHVQLSSPQVSRLISSHTLSQLPVNGRNFESLLALQPGVATTFTFNSYLGTNLGPTADTDVNGLTGESNNLVIDGAPSTRTRGNTDTIAPPSMAAIAEVNVVTNSFMPEYNRAAGGQIIATLKSGSDQYHGGVFEFDRNTDFDARSFFSTSVPKLDLNDFGFDIGGPVIPKKHKLYFFWTEEWLREVDGNTGLGTVPSVDDRNGDLANYCAATPDFCPKVPSYLNGVDGLVAGQAFPNDTVPTSLWSANGSAMARLFELPNTPGTKLGEANNYLYDYPTTEDDREDDIKIDYLATEKNHLAVTLRQFQWSSFNPSVASAEAQLLDQTQPFHDQSASVDLTTTFTPTLLNDLTVTGNRDIVHTNMSGGPGLDRTALGIDFPYIYGDSSKDLPNKIPSVTIAGYSEINGEPYPSHSAGHIYTIQDVLTKIAGNHTIKTGFWWEHDGENDDDQVRVYAGGGVSDNMNGYFTWDASKWNPNTTGSPYADALLGNFDSYSEVGFRNETPWTAFQVGPFAQDTWQATRRLTIMGGLRWDYYQPNSSEWNNWSMFNPLFYSFAPGVEPVVNPVTGYVTSGDPYDGIVIPGDGLPNSAIGHVAVFGQRVTASNIGQQYT